MKSGLTNLQDNPSAAYQPMALSVLRPHLWMVLLILFFPFFVICAHYFEALERTGKIGAIIADTCFQPTIVAYIVMLWMLKKRKI
jgi:phage shock protein PspC (stress-responsive transcriptional regulator)